MNQGKTNTLLLHNPDVFNLKRKQYLAPTQLACKASKVLCWLTGLKRTYI